MSLDERLKAGLEGLDAIETIPPDEVVDSVLSGGRRQRWVRRIAAACLTLAAAVAGLVGVPKVLDLGTGDPRPALPDGGAGIITTVAGTGTAWASGDGGLAEEAELEYPADLDFDGEGNLYILDLGNPSNPGRVRKVDSSGRITTVVGDGAPGEAGEAILGVTFGATGLAVDAAGNVFVTGGDGNSTDHTVIKVDAAGNVTTVAGTGEPGHSGDGGPATDATLGVPWDVAVDASGNLYFSERNVIRKVDASGIISTIAGTGKPGFSGDGGPATDALIHHPSGIAVDNDGNLFFIDLGNGRIRRIDTEGKITTIAGAGTRPRDECFFGEGVPATQAIFCGPEHLDVDAFGNVYVADSYNHRIRVIDTYGIITTIAGSGIDGYSGDGGSALEASLSEPSGLAVSPDGVIYIADSANNRVRKVVL
jgi:sugar lactone lactonase YvrE